MRTHNPTWFALSAIALAISTQTLAEEQQANNTAELSEGCASTNSWVRPVSIATFSARTDAF